MCCFSSAPACSSYEVEGRRELRQAQIRSEVILLSSNRMLRLAGASRDAGTLKRTNFTLRSVHTLFDMLELWFGAIVNILLKVRRWSG